MRVGVARALANCPILGFWESKVHRNGRFPALLWTPMNRRAKFDAASFILSSEKSVTVQQTHKQTNNKQYIHTCLSAYVDKSNIAEKQYSTKC